MWIVLRIEVQHAWQYFGVEINFRKDRGGNVFSDYFQARKKVFGDSSIYSSVRKSIFYGKKYITEKKMETFAKSAQKNSKFL